MDNLLSMETPLNDSNIVQISRLLSSEHGAVIEKEKIYGVLGLPLAGLNDIKQKISAAGSGSYGFFTEVLSKYCSTMGSRATVNRLLQCLSEIELTSAVRAIRRTIDIDNGFKQELMLRNPSSSEREGNKNVLQNRQIRSILTQTDDVESKLPTLGTELDFTNSSDDTPTLTFKRQYFLHDIKLSDNPLPQITRIKELALYHVTVSSVVLRKLFRNIRGLEIFKWFSFSPDSEFDLEVFNSLIESKLTTVVFKNVNLDFDGSDVSNIETLKCLKLWMCKCSDNVVTILAQRFPDLESIEFKGPFLGSEAGLTSEHVADLLEISNLKCIYFGPWTYRTFRIEPKEDPVMLNIFDRIGVPAHTWSPLITRNSSYKWEYAGENCVVDLAKD